MPHPFSGEPDFAGSASRPPDPASEPRKRHDESYFESQVSRPMRRRSIAALLAVGALALLSQIIVQVMLARQADNGDLINEAGRQRMHSQQITKLALMLNRARPEAVAELRTALSGSTAAWAAAQEHLVPTTGEPGAAATLASSERLGVIAGPLTTHHVAMRDAVADLLAADGVQSEAGQQATATILAGEPRYLMHMEELVEAMAEGAGFQVRVLQIIEIALLVLTLLVLELEYLFVFEPAAAVIRRQFASLVEQNRRLRVTESVQQSNDALREEIAVRRRVEDDLRAAHSEVRQLSLVASHTQHPIVLLGPDRTICWANDAFAAAFLYGPEESDGRDPVDLLRARETDRDTITTIDRSLKNGLPLATEIILRRSNGTVVWTELSLEPVHDPDSRTLRSCELDAIPEHVTAERPDSDERTTIEIAGSRRVRAQPLMAELADAAYDGPAPVTIVTLIDVTDRRRQSESLARAKEAAEDANLAKSRFLANMSHEIRTPLNAILGYGELLRKIDGIAALDSREPDPKRTASHYIETINGSGRHLLGLINDVLDLSKIEAGRMEFESQACSPYRIVEDIVGVLQNQAAEKRIRLESHWVTDVPRTISTDAMRMRQLLFNLVGNAVKFTDRGSVIVEAACYPGSEPSTPPRLELAVIDTGPGLNQTQQREIFEPFTQADASFTRNADGTGLGLTISRHIAEGLGGTLTVESVPGVGSRFTATIATGPLAADDLVPAAAAETSLVGDEEATGLELVARFLDGRRIFVCEDGRTNRDLIGIMLADAGAEVAFAENGQLGVDALLADDAPAFDLVLMDMQMPVLDGYAATRTLRERGCRLPIIALTAFAMRGDRKRCLAAGCTDYVTKPIEPNALFRTLARYLPPRPTPPAAEIESFAPASDETAEEAGAVDDGPIASELPADMPGREMLLERFFDELSELTGQMRTAGQTLDDDRPDWDELSRTAHAIQGTGGTVGYPCFTEPTAELERLARDRRAPEQAAELVERIGSLTDRVLAVPV